MLERMLSKILGDMSDAFSGEDREEEQRGNMLEGYTGEKEAVEDAIPLDLPDTLKPFAMRLPEALKLRVTRGAVLSPKEVAALDVLMEHGFSRRAIEKDGMLADYEALGVPLDLEWRWRMIWIREQLKDSVHHPEAVVPVAALAEEFGEVGILLMALEALDETVSAEQVPDEAMEAPLEQAALIFRDGRWPGDGDVEKCRALILELAERLERRIKPDRPTERLERIREAVTAQCG